MFCDVIGFPEQFVWERRRKACALKGGDSGAVSEASNPNMGHLIGILANFSCESDRFEKSIVLNEGQMIESVESLSGACFPFYVEGGAKFYSESRSGAMRAFGGRSGDVVLFPIGASHGHPISVRPKRIRTNFETELQTMVLSDAGDLLYAATSVDVLAVNTTTQTMAWEYQQKRQWGFLASVPQGATVDENDHLTVYYSSGEVVELDRKARTLRSDTFAHTVKMLSATRSRVFGSDGHTIWSWTLSDGFAGKERFAFQHHYSLAVAVDGDRIAMRTPGKIILFDFDGEVVSEFPVGAGLPQIAIEPMGRFMAAMAPDRVVIWSDAGAELGEFHVAGEQPISVYHSVIDRGIVVGMRSGSVYSVPWPV